AAEHRYFEKAGFEVLGGAALEVALFWGQKCPPTLPPRVSPKTVEMWTTGMLSHGSREGGGQRPPQPNHRVADACGRASRWAQSWRKSAGTGSAGLSTWSYSRCAGDAAQNWPFSLLERDALEGRELPLN